MKVTRPEVKFKGCGGLTDAYDDMFKQALNITDEEYNYICETASDEEIQVLCGFDGKFSEKRKALEIRNKYVRYFTTNN